MIEENGRKAKAVYNNELEKAISISVIKASIDLCNAYERPQLSFYIQSKLEGGLDATKNSIISG